MPRCPGCNGSMTIKEMADFGGIFYCRGCQETLRYLITQAREEAMSKGKGKKVFSLEVTQLEGEDEDYVVEASANYGGLTLTFEKTVDEIRRFFTERRDKEE